MLQMKTTDPTETSIHICGFNHEEQSHREQWG